MSAHMQEEYVQGQVIDVELALIFNHGGHFEFFLCDQRNGDQDCFDRHPLKTCAACHAHKVGQLRCLFWVTALNNR